MLEVLIAAALAIVLGVVGFIYLGGRRGTVEVQSSARQITAVLRDAQQRALSNASSTSWGVRFTNATATQPFYALFASSTYSTSSVVEYHSLPLRIAYASSSLASGASRDIVFTQGTGETATSSTIVVQLSSNASSSYTISVSSIGRVTYTSP